MTKQKQPQASTTTTEPQHILVLDNGGDTIKYGWATSHDAENAPDPLVILRRPPPSRMPNRTARLPQQWKILIGDEMETQVTNPNACIHVTQSLERGILTHLGNQIQVWKHILDRLFIHIPALEKSATAQCFGWTTNKKTSSAAKAPPILSHQCAVLIGVAPYTPRSILDQVLAIWMDDFSFARVGFFVSPVAAARPTRLIRSDPTETAVPLACVVDLGDSAIHIVPVYQGKVIGPIRRMPFGGKHLRQLWKYYCTYRQWNLMDAPYIVRDIMEQTSFISLQYREDLLWARRRPFGQRPYDCQYVLPNYTTTFRGAVVIPESVRKMESTSMVNEEPHRVENDEEEDDEDDEDYDENDVKAEEEAMEHDDNDDEMEEEEEEEESIEQVRIRLLKQREEERRLRAAEQEQVLDISTERFAIGEALFHPSDVGLPSDWANLPHAVLQAIQACPAIYHAGLYRSMQLTGGLSQLPNLKERLELELRSIVPCEYTVDISISDAPIDQAWMGAAEMARQQPMEQWSIGREEWEQSSSKRGVWKRLLMTHGGHIV